MLQFNRTNEFKSDSLIIVESCIYPIIDSKPLCNMIFIATYHPWLAAIKELKSIYLLITAISALCIWSISKNTIDTYDKQKSLEESKSSFIAAMAHDLKTPLTVIKGYSENLLDEGNDKNREYLRKIIGKTDEIDDMVSKMLDISKLDSGGFEMERKEVLLNDILNQAIVKYLPIMEQRSLEYTVNEKDQFYLIGDGTVFCL